MFSPFRPPLSSTLRPPSPTPARGPTPQPKLVVTKRRRISLQPNGASRPAEDTFDEGSEDGSSASEIEVELISAVDPTEASIYVPRNNTRSDAHISTTSTTSSSTAHTLRLRQSPSPQLANSQRSAASNTSHRSRKSPSPQLANSQAQPGLSSSRQSGTSSFNSSHLRRGTRDAPISIADSSVPEDTEPSGESSLTEGRSDAQPGQISLREELERSLGGLNRSQQSTAEDVPVSSTSVQPIDDRSISRSESWRVEYDAYLKSKAEARAQESSVNVDQSTSSVAPSFSQRPSTPPSTTIPLPPSPSIMNSPSRLSSKRDLDLLRQISPKKRPAAAAAQSHQGDESEEERARTESFETSSREGTPTKESFYSLPQSDASRTQDKTPQTRRSDTPATTIPNNDSDLEEPSQISFSKASMSFATPPRPRPGHHSRKNGTSASQRATELPELPSLPGTPDGSPVAVRTSASSRTADKGKGKDRPGSFDQGWAFPVSPSEGSPVAGADAQPANESLVNEEIVAAETPRNETPTPVPNFVGTQSHPKTPRPPGAWADTPVPQQRTAFDRLPISDDVDNSLPTLTPNTRYPQTPAPPGGWNFRDPVTPIAAPNFGGGAGAGDETFVPKTPAFPGGWNRSGLTPGNTSLRKGILKVRFDESSFADGTFNNLSGASDARELPDNFTLGENGAIAGHPHGHSRKGLPDSFHSTSNANGGNEAEDGSEIVTKSPGGTVRKRRTRLRMVDEFGNAVEPLEAEDEETVLAPPEADDYQPAAPDEIAGLRRVARTIPQLAKEFSDDSVSMTAPVPITSLGDQLDAQQKLQRLQFATDAGRSERNHLRRQLQLADADTTAVLDELAKLQQATQDSSSSSAPSSRRSRYTWRRIFFIFLFLLLQLAAVFVFSSRYVMDVI
ncbi:hypothetical protein DL93DRAFT_821762 [Clavulina sp. PMI_390]|nr:hypothetical protein DL93DRAFT_821762 [Clavulina sp. PMI_390]